MRSKFKISFVIPKNLQRDLCARVISDGYGLRGKSKWVSEAISRLLEIANYPELVSYSDEMQDFDKVENVVIDHATKSDLDQAIIAVRTKYPTIEGVKSRIVRTSILQRLLRTKQ